MANSKAMLRETVKGLIENYFFDDIMKAIRNECLYMAREADTEDAKASWKSAADIFKNKVIV